MILKITSVILVFLPKERVMQWEKRSNWRRPNLLHEGVEGQHRCWGEEDDEEPEAG